MKKWICAAKTFWRWRTGKPERMAAELKGVLMNRRTYVEDASVLVTFGHTLSILPHQHWSFRSVWSVEAFGTEVFVCQRLMSISSFRLKKQQPRIRVPNVLELKFRLWEDRCRLPVMSCLQVKFFLFSPQKWWQMDFFVSKKAPLVCDARRMNYYKPLYFLI